MEVVVFLLASWLIFSAIGLTELGAVAAIVSAVILVGGLTWKAITVLWPAFCRRTSFTFECLGFAFVGLPHHELLQIRIDRRFEVNGFQAHLTDQPGQHQFLHSGIAQVLQEPSENLRHIPRTFPNGEECSIELTVNAKEIWRGFICVHCADADKMLRWRVRPFEVFQP